MRELETTEDKYSQNSLLIIDDEENMRHMLTSLLAKSGYRVETAANGIEGIEKLKTNSYEYILCDLKMPKMNGMEFLEKGREYMEETTVIIMSAYGTIDLAIEAMKKGAYDYISKPFKADEVLLTLKKAEERESLRRENLFLKKRIQKIEEDFSFGEMVGKSKAMQAVFNLALKVARFDTTVLITGESGTGKELVARAVHENSDRADMPLIPVNCGGIPENLLESEFFGYKKGAFTGADRNKKGLFEEADKGTIFLDEIGELPLSLQVKLLRVLQESEIRPVGDSKTKQVDVRVIAATAKNLEESVREGLFRQDLYYRLNVITIRIPPLRERAEDIPLLSHHFLGKFEKRLGKTIQRIAPEAMNYLLRYQWPGNVRELENAIERAMVLTDQNFLGLESFPQDIDSSPECGNISGLYTGFSLKEAQKILEKNLITRALVETNGNRTHASRLLEISHPSLLSKIKSYNIDI